MTAITKKIQQLKSIAPRSITIDLKPRHQRVKDGLESAKSFEEFLDREIQRNKIIMGKVNELDKLFADLH